MDKDYSNLNHLYIRMPKYSDVDLIKACAKDNIGSSHIIENNFGTLSDIVYDSNKESNFKKIYN